MGFIIRVLIVFAIIYFAISLLGRILFGVRRKPQANHYSRQSKSSEKEPESQEERILDYQRKSFEASDAVDVDFEEIKGKE